LSDVSDHNDHEVAARLATDAGRLLLAVRDELAAVEALLEQQLRSRIPLVADVFRYLKDGGGKREAVEIVAESVQFLGSRGDGDGAGGGNQFVPAGAQQESADFPAATDDDIPF